MKRPILAILLAVSFAVSGTSTTYAVHSEVSLTDTSRTTVSSVREQNSRSEDTDSAEEKKLELEARKLELEQKLTEKRAAITKKLMGDRAEKCQKKEVNINSMIDKRIESAQKHYDTFKSIETRLTTLVKEKEIVIENENARLIIINDYEVDVQAAIDEMKEEPDFKCGDVDATAPGAIVKSQIATVKQALKDYRDSIKEYAQSIKDAVEAESEAPVEDEPATEEAPVEETPSTEQSIEGVQQ